MINNYKYVIYGERHSGTNLLHRFLEQYFGLTRCYDYGDKHFFDANILFNISKYQTKNVIFFCITRNPYDWLYAMYTAPHHCAFRCNNFIDFCKHEWWSRYEFLSNEILQDRHWSTQKRYKNIFELRSSKLEFFTILPRLVSNVYYLHFEDFVWHKQYDIATQISNRFNLPIIKSVSDINIKKHKPYFRSIDTNLFSFMNSNIDWNTESKFGYMPFISLTHFRSRYSSIDPYRPCLYDIKEDANVDTTDQTIA